MAEILPKGRLQEPQSADKLEALVYNTNNEVIRVAINVINDVVRSGTLNSAVKELDTHTDLLAEDTTTLEPGTRFTVKDDAFVTDANGNKVGTGLEYVTYALALQEDPTDATKTTKVWVVDSVGVPIASSTNDGLMTKTQWSKLEALPEGDDITQSITELERADETLEIVVTKISDDVSQNITSINALATNKLEKAGTVDTRFNSDDNGVRIIENRDAIISATGSNTGFDNRITKNEQDIASNDGDIDNLQKSTATIIADATALKDRYDVTEPLASNADSLSKANATAIKTNKGLADATEIKAETNRVNIAANAGNISSNATSIHKNGLDIIGAVAVNDVQNGRIEVLEQREVLDDKVWEGSIAGGDTVNIAAIVDQNGEGFDFTAGKKLEIVIEKVSASLEQAHDLITGATNATPYVIGQRSFTAKLDDQGIITMVETGPGDLTDFNVVRIIEAAGVSATAIGFTKNEALAQFAQKSTVAGLTTTVGANAAQIGINKTGISDNVTAIAGNASTIKTQEIEISGNKTGVGTNAAAIKTNVTNIKTADDKATAADTLSKANKTEIDLNTKNIADLGAKPVSGGTLLSTAETLATEKHVTDETTKVTTAYKAADTKIVDDQKVINDGKATVSLDNVKLSAADAGKFLSVKTDGGIEYTDLIKYYEGQHIDFIKEHAKFENTALFDKIIYSDGESKIGGTDKSISKGSVPLMNSPYKNTIAWNDNITASGDLGTSSVNMNTGSTGNGVFAGGTGGSQFNARMQSSGLKDAITSSGTMTGDSVKASGYKILKITYIAKKDIKESEMK